MVAINIDIKKVRSANYDLPSMISNLSAQKRNINMLKWRIPSEIQDRRDIRERLNAALCELDWEEWQLNNIYKVAGSAVVQYMNMETILTANALKFQ